MKVVEEPMPGLKLIEPTVFEDQRGYFFESYNDDKFKELGIDVTFIQDNQSLSQANVVRGLHFQAPPHAQDKLIRVIKGCVLDVAVDVRKGSPTYGQVYSHEINETNKLQLFIPKGFAHGFATLEDQTIFYYKCTNLYNKESEGGVLWNDPDLNIDWKVANPILSEKDHHNPKMADFDSPFTYEK